MRTINPLSIPMALACAWLVVGCGKTSDGPSSPPQGESGSRLLGIWQQVGEIRAPTRRWYDTTLQTECGFARDGAAYRCLPASGHLVYTDVACTRPAVQPTASEDATARLIAVDTSSPKICDPAPEVHHRVFRAGAKLPASTQLYDADCAPLGSREAYEIAEEVPIEATVVAQVTSEPLNGRIQARVLQAEDGTQQPFKLYDQELATRVHDQYGVFAPVVVSYVIDAFSDASCGTSVGKLATATCTSGYGVAASGTNACPGQPQFFRVDATQQTSAYQGSVDDCFLTEQMHPVTEELDWSEFVPRTRHLRGEERIRAVYAGSPGSDADIEWIGWYDSKFDMDCIPRTVEGGGERCLPGRDHQASRFSDAECRVPLLSVPECADELDPPRLIVAGGLDGNYTVHPVTGRSVTDIVYIADGHKCSPSTADLDEYYVGGAPMDIGEFAEVTEVTD